MKPGGSIVCEGNVSGGGEGLPDRVVFNLRPNSIGLRERASRHTEQQAEEHWRD